jgi:ferredoxin
MTVGDGDVEESVEVRIDDDVCIGGGQCELLAPEAFEVGDDGLGRVLPPGLVPRARALEIIDRCPSGAVSLVEAAPEG